MFELSEEELLMVSSDNSVRLTTHRIIHEKASGKREQMMLQDFVSYEFKNESIGRYDLPFFSFLTLFLILTINKLLNYFNWDGFWTAFDFGEGLWTQFWYDNGYMLLLLVVIIFHIFYKISRRYYIVIMGKYNSIKFMVKSFRNRSVKRMIKTLVAQSEECKKTDNSKNPPQATAANR